MGKRLLLLAIGACVAIGLMAGCSGGGDPVEDTMLQDPAVDSGGGVTDETMDPAVDAPDPAAEMPETDAGEDAETDAVESAE
jgi:hypothetical protein